MPGNFIHSRLDSENSRIILNILDDSGERVSGTAQITLDLTMLTGSDKDMQPREIIYKDAACIAKKRWVMCTAEESA